MLNSTFFKPFVNILFPNRCVFCNRSIDNGCCVCFKCRESIEIIQKDFCTRCGAPLQYSSVVKSPRCDQCREFELSFRRNQSLGVFCGILRELIHIYKFNRRRALCFLFTDLLKIHKTSYIIEHDILVPMPLSETRYSERGFNQSFLIASEISKTVGIPLLRRGLIRKGKSRPQSSIQRIEERVKNFSDQFFFKERSKKRLVNRNVLLLDDVFTTGATASACALSLYRAGVKCVDLLTLARAVRMTGSV